MLLKPALVLALLMGALASCQGQDAATEASVSAIPDSGEANAPGIRLTWNRDLSNLSYSVTYQAPNACYSAGDQAVETAQPGNVVTLRATVAYSGGICAQAITPVSFAGQVTGIEGPFSLTAEVTDARSGEVVTLRAE